jgi:signal transduction histidine kinase
VEPLPDGFAVADDGPGIADAEADRIFESGYTTSDDGTGWGLAIVASIVEAHDWSIEVTDSAAGGARFEIHDAEVTH